MSKVMVVTPTYCTEKNKRLPLLLQTVYWMQQQNYKNFKHVVVDDGSTDSTPDILEILSSQFDSLSVFHKENGGSSSAINFGVEQGLKEYNADYIAICHSDDLVLPKGLEERVKKADDKNLDMTYSDIIIFNEEYPHFQVFANREIKTARELYDSLLNHENFAYETLMWKRDLFTDKVQGYDPKITSAEDWDITLRTALEMDKHKSKFEGVSEPTMAYRMHRNNLGRSNLLDGTKWKCYKRILGKHFEGKEYRDKIMEEIPILGRSLVRHMLKQMMYLPEPIKKPLRAVQRKILPSYSGDPSGYNDFLKEVQDFNYKKAFSLN